MLKPIPKFELSADFAAEVSQLFVIFSDEKRWPEGWLNRILVVRAPGFVQVAFADMSRAKISIESLGYGNCRVSIEHELLADAEAIKHQTDAWNAYLKQLRGQVEN